MRAEARLKVRYGRYREGDTITGKVAELLIANGMATDVTPKEAPKRTSKKMGAAPENKDDQS